ncbi:MAG: response regulator transcription factor [Anaerolineae bacterium]
MRSPYEGREATITILLVESDREMARRIEEILTAEGMRVVVAANREETLSHTDDGEVDIVILGLNRSKDVELCWQIRERTTVPLLVLAEDGKEAVLARGLEWGADTYLKKPFTVRIFLAQVYALLRRIGGFRAGHAGQLQVGGLVINVTRHEVMVDEEPVHLTPTEYRILSCLVRNSGRALSHRGLVKQVHGYDCDLDEAREILKVHIHNLRRKIEPRPHHPRFIRSVRGFGYMFERRRYDRERLDRTLTKP